MVKLVRLTSTNDATFKSNFDSEIKLGANAQVALHNLTFESDFSVLDVNQNNSVVTTQGAPSFDETYSVLNNTSYKTTNYKDFFVNLGNALNASLFVGYNDPNEGAVFDDTYASFETIGSANSGRRFIDYQTIPVSLPFHRNEAVKSFDTGTDGTSALRNLNGGVNRRCMTISPDDDGYDSILVETNFGGRGELNAAVGSLKLRDVGSTDLRRFFVSNSDGLIKFSNGSGIFGCYLKTLIDQAGEPSNIHGFGMGLSFTDLSLLNPSIPSSPIKIIPESARDFEIIVEKTTDFYSFMTPDTETPTVSTLTPYEFGGLNNTFKAYINDQLIIERSGGQIKGSIWNSSVVGGYRHELFDYTLPNDAVDQSLYPYIYIKGGQDNCEVGRPFITFDSIFEDNTNQEFIGNVATLGGKLVPGAPVGGGQDWSTVLEWMAEPPGGTNNWSNLVPYINPHKTQEDLQTPYSLTLSNQVFRYMGFSKSQYDGDGYSTLISIVQGDTNDPPLAWGFRILADNIFELINSDSYVVELQNIALESFDASVVVKSSDTNRGKRRNILDVIPVNNSTGIVEYAANEALYIDLKNAEPFTIANLDIRVLNKNLEPINTVGMSVITILFKDS